MNNKYKNIAENMKYYRSCIMVDEQKYLDQFLKLGIKKIRKNNNGVLICDIPINKINEFVDLYLQLMQPGRWNEYIGPKTGFYLKKENGETLHILLNETTEKEINKTLKEFIPNWKLDQDIWEWLRSIDIYEDLLSDKLL